MWKYFKVVMRLIPVIVYSYFAWIIKYSRHPEKYPFEKRFERIQKLIRKVLKAFGVKYYLHGEDVLAKVGDKSCLIVCNHISFIDPLFFIAIAKRPFSVVAKVETKKMPLVGRIVMALEGEFIERDNLKQELKCFIRVQKRLEESNLDYVIFPEGTRHQDYNMGEFHHGSFRCAVKTNHPILVCAISGSQKVLDSKINKKHYPIDFSYIDYIESENYQDLTTKDIAFKAQSEVKETLDEMIVINERRYKELNKIKK